jgi:hypothetical protein
MGAGNTFSGIDDYNAIFYNPAALALIEEGEINMGLQVGAHPKIQEFTKEVEDAGGSDDEAENIENVGDVLAERAGDHYSIRGPLLNVIWARPGWGFAFTPIDPSINLSIHQAGSPAAGVKAIQDSTLAFAMAWSMNDQKTFNLGATAKAVYRASIDRSYTAFDLAEDSKVFRVEDVYEGMLVDADVGVSYIIEPPAEGFFSFLEFAKPTFSAVFRNVLNEAGYLGNMHLYSKDSNKDEKPILNQRRFDIGSKWEFPQWWVFENRFMFDVRDVGHRYWSFIKGLHMGYEANWKVSDWFNGGWRFGVSQGYLTGGFAGEFLWFHLDLVTFAEEIGTTKAKKENRIYMAKVSLDF